MEVIFVLVLFAFVMTPLTLGYVVARRRERAAIEQKPQIPAINKRDRTIDHQLEVEWDNRFNDETLCDCRPFDVCVHTEEL